MAQNAAAVSAERKPKRAKRPSHTSGMSRALVRRETISAYLFLLPSLFFFVAFVVVPMVICVVYSFLDYGLGGVQGPQRDPFLNSRTLRTATWNP